jgi:hypothetical protein
MREVIIESPYYSIFAYKTLGVVKVIVNVRASKGRKC